MTHYHVAHSGFGGHQKEGFGAHQPGENWLKFCLTNPWQFRDRSF